MHGANPSVSCAEALVRMLEAHGVTHVFGIPGAKIDSVFIALQRSSIRLVLVRHEQNAAFMAAAFGRLTGRVGVCLATSGPGVTNLVTGLATATSEGDPVLAIGGEAPLQDRLKQTHQSLDATTLMRPVTKFSAEVVLPGQLGEIVGNAIRAAESGRPGAAFVSVPKDVGLAPFPGNPSAGWGRRLVQGPADTAAIEQAAAIIGGSRRPMLLLGLQASQPAVADAIRNFLAKTALPYAATFQGPGRWAQPAETATYTGRVGLFCNQPADAVLAEADCIITIGFDPVEYDCALWNHGNPRPVIAIDVTPASQDNAFVPSVDVVGALETTLPLLADQVTAIVDPAFRAKAEAAMDAVQQTVEEGAALDGFPLHPLRIIHAVRQVIGPDTRIALDVGSHYIWMNRYYASDFARQVLVSNGQQTLGVALPWAIALSLLHPGQPILSVSGDGGFLFSAMELETARRVGARFVHLIWDSRSFDMVSFQEKAHYGETAGVALGRCDIVQYAAAFGCKGYEVDSAAALGPLLREAFQSEVPVLINIPVDYRGNMKLMQDVAQSFVN